MKKALTVILALCLLLSLAACAESGIGSNKKVRIYVVTEQKIYENGELVCSATFEYDDHGRPTVVGFVMADGTGRKSELTYDKQGNLVGDARTYLYANSSENRTQQTDWTLTYTDGLLTRAERPHGDKTYALDFSYNDDEQLILAEYPHPDEGMGPYFWQSYDYDADGKLIRETRCSIQNGEYIYSRYCYFYDEQGRFVEQYYCSAVSDTRLGPEALDQLDFKVSPYEHFFLYYDEEGRLAYIGDGAEDTYPGGRAEIYSDENYTFDENGNLVRIEQGKKLGHDEPSWTEFTYKAIELTESDAVMHKRLIHGISNFTLSYTANNTMDPLFWEMCPTMLYSNNLQSMNFYYMLPYPQFELFLPKSE